MTLHDIYARERDIAAREGIPWDRIDRVWLRSAAIKSLSPPADAISDAFEAVHASIVKLEAEREERVAWLDSWRPGDRP
jgi:hypothetical protein